MHPLDQNWVQRRLGWTGCGGLNFNFTDAVFWTWIRYIVRPLKSWEKINLHDMYLAQGVVDICGSTIKVFSKPCFQMVYLPWSKDECFFSVLRRQRQLFKSQKHSRVHLFAFWSMTHFSQKHPSAQINFSRYPLPSRVTRRVCEKIAQNLAPTPFCQS
jgi:hypothetical protein